MAGQDSAHARIPGITPSILAVFPTADHSRDGLARHIDSVSQAIDLLQEQVDVILQFAEGHVGSVQQHLILRYHLTQKDACAPVGSGARLVNLLQWVVYLAEQDDLLEWYDTHDKYLQQISDELEDQCNAFEEFWVAHAGITQETHTYDHLEQCAEIITTDQQRLRILGNITEHCAQKTSRLWEMPKWRYWTNIVRKEDLEETTVERSGGNADQKSFGVEMRQEDADELYTLETLASRMKAASVV